MSERLNKASICSVVFLGILDQSKNPVVKQIKDKELLNSIIDEAIKDVARNNRLLVNTNDGTVLALSGAPEEALFVAMTIRDAIVKHNKTNDNQLFVRTGISIGPVRLVIGVSGLQSIEGDGVDAAERAMNLARPNQILVSRAYYEITSGLTDEITGMFSDFGGEQEVYSIRSPEEEPFVPESVAEPVAADSLFSRLLNNEDSPRFGLWSSAALIAIVTLVGGFMLISDMHPDLSVVIADSKPAHHPNPNPAMDVRAVSAPSTPTLPAAPVTHEAAPNLESVIPEPATTTVATQPTTKSRTKRRATTHSVPESPIPPVPVATSATTDTQIDVAHSNAPGGYELKPEERVIPSHEEKKVAAAPPVRRGPIVEERRLPSRDRPKTVWDAFRESVKQGRKEHLCTQAEIALNQCR